MLLANKATTENMTRKIRSEEKGTGENRINVEEPGRWEILWKLKKEMKVKFHRVLFFRVYHLRETVFQNTLIMRKHSSKWQSVLVNV